MPGPYNLGPGPYTVGMFMNLKRDNPEKLLRKTAFLEGLISVNPALLKSTQVIVRHADGDFVTEREHYNVRSQSLKDAGVHLYFASCRPTARHIDAVNKQENPLVVAGAFHAEPFSSAGWGYNEAGYISYDIHIVDKWVELFLKILKMPGAANFDAANVAVIGDTRNEPNQNPGAGAFYDKIKEAITQHKPNATVTHVTLTPNTPKSQIERDLIGKHGVIVLGLTNIADRRADLIDVVNNLKIPALYPNRFYVTSGGLISYGINLLSLYRDAGKIAGTLLTGGTADLNMADPRVYREVTLNLKTADSLHYSDPQMKTLKDEANVMFKDDD